MLGPGDTKTNKTLSLSLRDRILEGKTAISTNYPPGNALSAVQKYEYKTVLTEEGAAAATSGPWAALKEARLQLSLE